jgi:ankyrin repeat protein
MILPPAHTTNLLAVLFVFLSILTMSAGCSPERMKPEDFPRQEREEVIVAANPESTAAAQQDLPAGLQPTREDAFREAAMKGNLAQVQQLFAAGCEINSIGPDSRTALQLASFDGHEETVDWLIAQAAEIDHRDDFGRTALMYAATGDNGPTVSALLAAGAEVDAIDKEEHFTALMYAAAEGQLAVVKILLSAGADPARLDIDGESSLDFARANGHAAVVQELEKTASEK